MNKTTKILVIAAVMIAAIAVIATLLATGAFTPTVQYSPSSEVAKVSSERAQDSSKEEVSSSNSEMSSAESQTSSEEIYSKDSYESNTSSTESEGNSSMTSSSATPKVTYNPREIIRPKNWFTGNELTQAMVETSVINSGNRVRLANKIQQLMDGGEFTVGFIGGSITEGFHADMGQSYSINVEAMLGTTFPEAEISSVNAGIGATGSYIAVHRLEEDMLKYKPDLVFIDFCVNDSYSFDTTAYESMLQRIWSSGNQPAIINLAMVHQSGSSKQDVILAIAKKYDLPMLSYGDIVMKHGLNWTEISPDDIHPNNTGHMIISQMIEAYILDTADNLSKYTGAESKLPLDGRYTTAQLLNVGDITPKMNGFTENKSGKIAGHFEGIWESSTAGATLEFTAEGKRMSILYGNLTDGGVMNIYVDGKLALENVSTAATFDYVVPANTELVTDSGKHTIKIEVVSGNIKIAALTLTK